VKEYAPKIGTVEIRPAEVRPTEVHTELGVLVSSRVPGMFYGVHLTFQLSELSRILLVALD
jgi:hypothetical protein